MPKKQRSLPPMTEKEAMARVAALSAKHKQGLDLGVSPRENSRPSDLVDAVMKKHGFTEEEAISEIEKFGG